MTGPVQPALRAIDAIWPADPGMRMAQAGGATTANIMPGSGNVLGGQTAYVKLHGSSIKEMLIPGTLGGYGVAARYPKLSFASFTSSASFASATSLPRLPRGRKWRARERY